MRARYIVRHVAFLRQLAHRSLAVSEKLYDLKSNGVRKDPQAFGRPFSCLGRKTCFTHTIIS